MFQDQVPHNVAETAKVVIKNTMDKFIENPMETVGELGQGFLSFGMKLIITIAVYFIGAWIIQKLCKVLKNILVARNTDATITTFVVSFVKVSLSVLLIIVCVGTLGVDTSSLVAILAAGSLAIGMAVSGTVQNFAGGLMILFFKPFRVGHFIEAQGVTGTVEAITVVNTKIKTPDGRVIILPNGALSNSAIDNYSIKPFRRITFSFDFEYGVDAEKCIEELKKIFANESRILKAVEIPGVADPLFVVSALKDNSVEFKVRVWCKAEDYWPLTYEYNQKVYSIMPEKGFGFPFPQLQLHYNQKA